MCVGDLKRLILLEAKDLCGYCDCHGIGVNDAMNYQTDNTEIITLSATLMIKHLQELIKRVADKESLSDNY